MLIDIWRRSLTWYLFEKVSPNASEWIVNTSRLLRSPGKTGRAELLGSGPNQMIFCMVKKRLSQDILVLTCLGLGTTSGISVPPCPDTCSCFYCHTGTLCESESEQGYQGLAPNFVFFALTSLVSAWIIALGYRRCWPLMWHSTSDWLRSNYTSLRLVILQVLQASYNQEQLMFYKIEGDNWEGILPPFLPVASVAIASSYFRSMRVCSLLEGPGGSLKSVAQRYVWRPKSFRVLLCGRIGFLLTWR